jgi:elongation factor G
MAKYTTADIRNVALIGHNGSGKTSLADMMLFKAKAVQRRGTVVDGTSVFDFDPEEKDRKVTVETAVASCSWEGREINILDTPGYSDLIAQTIMALRAAESAVLCINALAGVMVNTRKVWEEAKRAGAVRVVMVTKVDQGNLALSKLFADLREQFGPECIPVLLPDRAGPEVQTVVDGILETSKVAEEWRSLANEAKEKIIEADDALLERYLEGGEIKPADILTTLPKAILAGKIVPVLCSSVEKDVGVGEFLDFVAKYLPSPLARRHRVVPLNGGEPRDVAPDPDGPLAAQVFKCVADPFVRKYVYFKVVNGTLKNDKALTPVGGKDPQPVGGLFKPFGKDQRQITAAVAGDIAVATKLDAARVSHTYGDNAFGGTLEELKFPTPMISLAVLPKTKQDETKLTSSLEKLAEADPTFVVHRDHQTGELVITGISQLHLDIMLNRLKRLFEVSVTTKPPKVAFMETILASAEGHHRHKKQTGGRGQFGEVFLRIEPQERGKGFEFADEIKGGKIPGQFVPAVEKGVRAIMERGILAGCRIVDVRAAVYDGNYHVVDSDSYSFEIAGYKAFLEAFLKAKPVLLEPIVSIEVTVPVEKQGAVNAQINSKRGIIETMDTQGMMQVIRARIPLLEVLSYGSELTSITGGEGSFTMEFSHYDVLPARIADDIIRRHRATQQEEKE